MEKPRIHNISASAVAGPDEPGGPDPLSTNAPPPKSFFLTLVANVGILALTVVTGTLNARLLGPTGRGELAAIQTIPAALGMFALLGIPSAVGYFVARRRREARILTLTGVGICLAASIPVMIVGYFLMPWLLHSQPPAVIWNARLYLVFVGLQAMVMLPYMALQGLGKFGVWNVLRLAPNFATVGAIAWAWGANAATSGGFSRRFLVLYALLVPLTHLTLWLNSERQSGRAWGGSARAR